MTSHTIHRALIAALLVPVFAVPATPADVYLVAKSVDVTMSDGRVVPMWGYALDADQDLTTDGGEVASSPGPAITLLPTDTSLTIHLRNELPEPTSLVMPGQVVPMSPVFFTDAGGLERVRSFTHETAPGAIGSYDWPNLSEGTYLYQSGTHPAVQVQMGLYGALTRDFVAGQVYSYGASRFDNEATLVFSEVDPDLHDAVATGAYGSPPWESTIGYRPQYFLVNGKSYPDTVDLPVGGPQSFTVLRMLNAGQEARSLSLRNGILGVVGEQGRRRPHVGLRAAVPLPAGSTRDVMTIIPGAGSMPLFDRTMALSNGNGAPGGMIINLVAIAAADESTKFSNMMASEDKLDTIYAKIGDLQLMTGGSAKKQAARAKKVAKLQAKAEKWQVRIDMVRQALGLESIEDLMQ